MSSLLLLQRGDVRRAAVGSAQMAQAEMSGLFFLGSRQGVTKGTLRWDAIKMSVTSCYQLWTASFPPVLRQNSFTCNFNNLENGMLRRRARLHEAQARYFGIG